MHTSTHHVLVIEQTTENNRLDNTNTYFYQEYIMGRESVELHYGLCKMSP